MIRTIILGAFALFLMTITTTAANATSIVLSNFAEERVCCFGIVNLPFITFSGAQSFTTGDFDVSINTIRTELDFGGATQDDLLISLFTSENGLPGQQIGDPLSIIDVTPIGAINNGNFDTVTFSANDLILTANTTFWIVFATLGGNPQFQLAATPDSIGFALGSVAVNDGSGFSLSENGNPFLLEIDATALSEVPLPAAAWVFLAGLAGLGFSQKRKS